MVILIREIEGGTDSNNRKITVIIILDSPILHIVVARIP